jgi:hypothetical protein
MNVPPSTHLPTDALLPATVAPPVSPPPGGDDKLENILPQIRELAQKVGGFAKLAEIVHQLEGKDG